MQKRDETGDCTACSHKKALSNKAFRGVRIPDGPGKCVRPYGLCESKEKAREGGAR